MNLYKQKIQSILQQISDILLINGTFLNNPGLYTGKTGIALFFFRYAHFTQNELYSDYSFDLFEKIQNDIHQDTSINYKQGLTGIGSTIEYLIQNNFLEANADEILEDFDKRIFFTYNLPYLSIDEIIDIGYYALWRLSGRSVQKDTILNSVIPSIVNAMNKWQTDQNRISPTVSSLRELFLHSKNFSIDNQSNFSYLFQLCRKNKNNSNETKLFMHLLEQFNNLSTNNELDFGIQNGLAGVGLFLISKLDHNNSWLSLFPDNLIFCEQ